MDERLLATFGLIWNILNIVTINSCIQLENSELQKKSIKMSPSSHSDETHPIPTALQLSIILCVIFQGLILMRRIYTLDDAISLTENTEQPTRCLFFKNNLSDTSSSEDEDHILTPKKIN